MKFEADGREFAKFLRSLEQFIQPVKGQTNYVTECFFKFSVPGDIIRIQIRKKYLKDVNCKGNCLLTFISR